MLKKVKKLTLVLLTMIMVFGIIQIKTAYASDERRIEYDVPSSLITAIYCYGYDNNMEYKLIETITDGRKILPNNTECVTVRINTTYINIIGDVEITTNTGKSHFTPSNSKDYEDMTIYTRNGDARFDFKYSQKRNFGVGVRRICNGTDENKQAAENIINKNPSKYLLYNEDHTLEFEGTCATFNVNTGNFAHWKKTKGNGSYIGTDDTKINNLPNGKYTILETDPGGTLKTIPDQTSSTVWLNASFMKKQADGKFYYTFDVTDELVDKWMEVCMNQKQQNSMFFGFYVEDTIKTYTVNYNGNGHNQGIMRNHSNLKADDNIEILENNFERWGYEFIEWNTVANPTKENPGTVYHPKDTMKVTGDATLYAQWKMIVYSSDHAVYLHDQSDENSEDKLLASQTIPSTKLAYKDEELNKLLLDNMLNGYKYISTVIEIKRQGSDVWETFESQVGVPNFSQVRYILTVDKDLKQTKDLLYKVEYWLEGEDEPRDTVNVEKTVWIGDKDEMIVQPITLNEYEGYEFSHYDPQTLPTTLVSGSTIKVYYNKINIPVVPDEPTIPTQPTTPDIPDVPVQPTTPNIPNVPVQPVTPIIPGVVTPAPTVVTPVVRTPENVTIEEDEVPTTDGVIEKVEDNETPLASPKGVQENAWALINLISTVATIILAAFIFISKHKKEEDEEKEMEQSSDDAIYVRRRWTKVVSVIVAVASFIIFVLTENITLPMIMVDKWTLLMVIIFIVQVIITIVSRQWKNDKDQKEKEVIYN